ncbi:conserved unknown protein [Ectocarpus siliculosus]|uniref:DUF3730 domain-containing protein n=1 Tax=Ectocarpus siliculosus TaxID=2880 RepID=D8LLV3_ECTSI|nr:conserved unknown protein [Ectocarpus siliculosus]|eukprot:CBN77167.1 conserved unknown protein [Ectocarpus siliculosus]
MRKDLTALLARAEVDQVETSQNAISRLVKLVAEDSSGVDAREALFGCLGSSRLAVVSSGCQGLTQLLESQDSSGIDLIESGDELVRHLKAAMAREEDQRNQQGDGARHNQEHGVTQCLTRCLVAISRLSARREAQPTCGGEKGVWAGVAGNGVSAMLLSMNRGLLFPALSHETTCFLSRLNTDPREAVRVVCPLASALLLQPEYANLRSGFMLKLSMASATASDAVKLCLLILQAELLVFGAMHTGAHADVAAGWFCSLVNTAVSLDSDPAWDRASRALAGVGVFLLSEFRGRGVPITPVLSSMQFLVAADPLCLADEVAFLGITALQSHCIDEREALLDIVGRTLSAMAPRVFHDPKVIPDNVDVRVRAWSLETLVYPLVSMAATGNPVSANVLPLLEAALGGVYSRSKFETMADARVEGDRSSAGNEHLRLSSPVALGIRRLGVLDGDQQAMVVACMGLKQRANDLSGSNGGVTDAGRDASAVADLECGLCLLAPLLLQQHEQTHEAVCTVLVAVVRAVPSLGVRLLPFVLYGIRKLGGVASEGGSVARLLHLLPELGAHKLSAKPVAAVIQALAKAPQQAVRGLGMRLVAALVQVNPRTFNQLQSLLSETPADHTPPLSPEPDESRLCRAAGMLEICETDPELGLECVRPLQGFLGDGSSAVTALALKAIAALCRSDCLDFGAALRIVTKKGKVAHTGRDDSDAFGDPRVMESMAQLCGAGAEAVAMAAAEAAEAGSDGSGEDSDLGWGMGKAVEILLAGGLGCHPDDGVRSAVYEALGFHLPALLRAVSGKNAEEEAIVAARHVRVFLAQAMSTDGSFMVQSNLRKVVQIVVAEESVEPSTWVSAKRDGASRDGGQKRSVRPGPSNRLVAALPEPESVLQGFRQDDSSCPGLAGAVLWSYPTPQATAVVAHRDIMIRDFGELMAVEGTGGGLALCPWQRAGTLSGIQRYVARLFAACVAAESTEAAGRGEARGGTDVTAAAVEACRQAIGNIRGVQGGLVAVASASLASCVPASFYHVAVVETGRAVDRLRRCTGGAQTLLDGEEMFPLCAAMAVRALPEASTTLVESTLEEIERFHSTAVEGWTTSRDSAAAVGEAMTPNEAQSFWSCVAVGVASEWGLRHPTAPGARIAVLRAVRCLLAGLANAVRSDHIHAIVETWFGGNGSVAAREDRAAVVDWESVDIGQAIHWEDSEIGLPTTTRGSICLALFLGLSSSLPGLRATGLHSELLQVFSIVQALALKPLAGLCGATLCLAAAASECISCGLVDAPVILTCLRSVSVSLDGLANPSGSEKLPAQDTSLGAAGLIVVCEGKVVLPPGFAESLFESLRKAAAHRRGANSGVRVASLLALASLIGCPLMAPGELVPRRLRVTSITNRRMVDTLLQDVLEAMQGTSIRLKNAAARVWGCLSALGQDERSVGNSSLQASLGWTEDGGTHGISGPATASIRPGALRVAQDGTLMNVVLTGLQSIATGLEDIEDGDTKAENYKAVVPVQSSLFAASAMASLTFCPTLRIPHPQMAIVIEALFRGGHGVEVQVKCISLGLALADKEQAYSTWLRGLFDRPFFVNLPRDVQHHLVAVFDQIFLKLPSEIGKDLAKKLWDTITPRFFTSWSRASGPEREGVVVDGKEGSSQAAAFLSGMSTLVAAGTRGEVESMTLTRFWPSVLHAFCTRDDLSRFDLDVEEAPFWDALVGLLSHLPWEQVQDAIASKPGATNTKTASVQLCEECLREYLTTRLTPPGEASTVFSTGGMFSRSSRPSVAATIVTAKALGSVARWATRIRTDRKASAAVLPRLAEALKRINATAAAGKWLVTLLDTAELPESCVVRAAALAGGATDIWEPSNTGLLIVGERSDALLGCGAWGTAHGCALWYSLSVTAPRAVARVDRTSPDVSTDVLARLLRLTGLLHGRIGDAKEATDQRRVVELEEVAYGVEGFIRGLRHAPAVLNGTLSRSFATYVESVAAHRALE